MINNKLKLVDKSSGKVLKAVELWTFFATIKNLDGSVVTDEKGKNALKDIKLDGLFMGNSKEANELVKQHQEELAKQYPDKKIIVKPIAAEKVGPIIQQQMKGLMFGKHVDELVTFYLAEQLAEYKKREQLDITTDKSALGHQLVIEARMYVQKRLADIANGMTDAANQSGLVGPDEKPLPSVLGSGDNGGPFNPEAQPEVPGAVIAAQQASQGPVLVTP